MPGVERDAASVCCFTFSPPCVPSLTPKTRRLESRSLPSLTFVAVEQLDKVSVVLGNVGDCLCVGWGDG